MIWCIANTLITASHACVGKLVEWLEWGHARGGKRFIAIFFFFAIHQTAKIVPPLYGIATTSKYIKRIFQAVCSRNGGVLRFNSSTTAQDTYSSIIL